MSKNQINEIRPGSSEYRKDLWNLIAQAEVCDLINAAMDYHRMTIKGLTTVISSVTDDELEAFLGLKQTLDVRQLSDIFYVLSLSLVISAKPLPQYDEILLGEQKTK